MKIILKKSRWFTATTTLCLAIVTLFSISGCDKSDIPLKTDVNVSFTPCQQNDMMKSKSLSDKADVNVEFTNEGVKIMYHNFAVTCDFTNINVTHTLVNGVLNITQQGTPNQANCVCHSDVSYTIDGILQNEVNVIFINGMQVYCYNENTNENTIIGKWELIAEGYYDSYNNNTIVINPVETIWQPYIEFFPNGKMKRTYFLYEEHIETVYERPFQIDEQFLYENYIDEENAFIYKYKLDNDKLTLTFVQGNIEETYMQIVIHIYQRLKE